MSLSREDDLLSEDEIFNLLSSARRRSVLRRLIRDDGPVGLQELADEIAAEENDKVVDELTDRERKRVYVSLYQTHVPTMADTGVLDYDPESGSIVPRESAGELRSYLTPEATRSRPRLEWQEGRRERDVTWQLTNAGLAVIGFAALVIAFTSPAVDPVTNVGAVALGTLGTVAFALLAVRWTREESGHRRRLRPTRRGVWVVDSPDYPSDGASTDHVVEARWNPERRGGSRPATEHAPEARRADPDEN